MPTIIVRLSDNQSGADVQALTSAAHNVNTTISGARFESMSRN